MFEVIRNVLTKENLVIIILIIASYTDIRRRIVTNKTILFIGIIGLMNFSLQNIIIGFALGMSFLICALITKTLGGGDVKLVLVCGIALGLQAIAGAVIGLTIALFVAPLINKIKGLKYSSEFPLVPYLTIGFTLSTIIRSFN